MKKQIFLFLIYSSTYLLLQKSINITNIHDILCIILKRNHNNTIIFLIRNHFLVTQQLTLIQDNGFSSKSVFIYNYILYINAYILN